MLSSTCPSVPPGFACLVNEAGCDAVLLFNVQALFGADVTTSIYLETFSVD